MEGRGLPWTVAPGRFSDVCQSPPASPGSWARLFAWGAARPTGRRSAAQGAPMGAWSQTSGSAGPRPEPRPGSRGERYRRAYPHRPRLGGAGRPLKTPRIAQKGLPGVVSPQGARVPAVVGPAAGLSTDDPPRTMRWLQLPRTPLPRLSGKYPEGDLPCVSGYKKRQVGAQISTPDRSRNPDTEPIPIYQTVSLRTRVNRARGTFESPMFRIRGRGRRQGRRRRKYR